jgi:type III secretion protein Q
MMLAAEATPLGSSTSLPRVTPELRRALNRLYSSAAGGNIALPKLAGDVSFLFMSDGLKRLENCERFRFRAGKFSGELCLEEKALRVLLGEVRAGLLPAELRYVLLADALHPLVDKLEKVLQVGIEWLPPVATAAGEMLENACDECSAFFSVSVPSESAVWCGFVCFDNEAALEALVPATIPVVTTMETFDYLHVPLSFCVGTTRLSIREVREISPGDIVSVEEWSSVGSAVCVRAVVGGIGGRVLTGLAEGSRITLQPEKDETMNRNPLDPSLPPLDTTNLPLDRLDALEVTLQFDLGDLSVSLGELKTLRPGHIFDLGQPLNRSTVRILAHGNVLGKGHLVAVGERLGLRVSEFAANGL